jgi:hypothetical protein
VGRGAGVPVEALQQWREVGTRPDREVLGAEGTGSDTEVSCLAGDGAGHVDPNRDLIGGQVHG